MMGRLDIERIPCTVCHGTGRDPKKRKRKCSACWGDGTGTSARCLSCGQVMPCPGTDPDIMDQTYCLSVSDNGKREPKGGIHAPLS